MYQFRFYNPVTVYFGLEKFDELPTVARYYGDRALVLYSEAFNRHTDYVDMILRMLKERDIYTLAISESMPNPRGEFVDRISRLCRNERIEVLIGIGGGSVLDSVKAISASVYTNASCWEWITGKEELKMALPVIAVPTTAATGSEMNSGGLISFPERREKLSFGHPLLFPKAAFIIPEFTASQSREYTAAGCSDVMFHIMEGNYFTRAPKMETHLKVMEELMKNLVKYSRIVVEDLHNYDARANLCVIASWALNGFLENGTGRIAVCHALEHQISGYYDIPHAKGMAVIVPKWLRYIAERGGAEQVAEFGKAVFDVKSKKSKLQTAIETVDKLEYFLYAELMLPSSFLAYGITDKHFNEMVQNICHGGKLTGIINLDSHDLVNILNSCL